MKLRNKLFISTFLIAPILFNSGSLYSSEYDPHSPDVASHHGGHKAGNSGTHNNGNNSGHHKR